MQPTNEILQAVTDLLANDSGTIAPAALALHVHLSKTNFTPAPNLDVGSFTEADFTGATALDAGVGACQVFIDPATGLRTIQFNEPAGGWTWLCTVDPAPAQVIYGYYVTDNADAVLYGMVKFPTPVTISTAGQAVTIPYIRFTFSGQSPT